MAVKELGHVALLVGNLEKSAHFYGEILGLTRLQYPFPPHMAFFTAGRTHHEIAMIEIGAVTQQTNETLPRQRVHHIAFKVGNTLDELRMMKSKVESAGIKVVGMTDVFYTQSIVINDPDGNEVELYIDAVQWNGELNSEVSLVPKPLVL
jgi:catechol 2,3-dioxygenase